MTGLLVAWTVPWRDHGGAWPTRDNIHGNNGTHIGKLGKHIEKSSKSRGTIMLHHRSLLLFSRILNKNHRKVPFFVAKCHRFDARFARSWVFRDWTLMGVAQARWLVRKGRSHRLGWWGYPHLWKPMNWMRNGECSHETRNRIWTIGFHEIQALHRHEKLDSSLSSLSKCSDRRWIHGIYSNIDIYSRYLCFFSRYGCRWVEEL